MAQVEIINGIRLNSSLIDYNGDTGTSGQILSSTGDGVNWVDAPASGISGSGSAGQVTFWNGTSSVTGENNLWWDSTNDRLGINNTSPDEKIEISDTNATGANKIKINSYDGVEILSTLWIGGDGNNSSVIDVSTNTVNNGIFTIRGYNNSTYTDYASWGNTGQFLLPQYGSGSFTGTAAKMLAVTNSGEVIEETLPASGISGSGAAGQVAFWNGASSIAGENNLWWDSTNDRLGIGTLSPQSDLDVAGIIRSSTSSTEYGMMQYISGDFKFYSRNGASKGDFEFIVTSGASVTSAMRIWGTGNVGQMQLVQYGSGTITGTATKMLAVDNSGKVIEDTLPTGGGSMDDWIISADAGLGWPHTVTDGDTVTIAGGTNISTLGSTSGNTVTINQDQYYQTFHFNSSDKNTGGTYYMEWDSAGAQSSLNQQCQYIPLRNGDFTKIKWFSAVAVSSNITMTLYNNTTSLWTSGSFTSSANTAVNFTPNVAISENQRLNLEVVYPSGYGGGFNITAEFAWDL